MNNKSSKNDNTSNNEILSKEDFYPPADDRVWESYIEDIEDGDNFADYCKYFFRLCLLENHYEN